MKTFLQGVLCIAFILAGARATAQTPGPTLIGNGVTYQDVHFGQKHGNTVDIFYSGGAANIPMDKLPPEFQKQLGYKPKKTAAVQKPAATKKTPEPKPLA